MKGTLPIIATCALAWSGAALADAAPAFDPGDHVHPNDAGNAAMAAAIDLGRFLKD